MSAITSQLSRRQQVKLSSLLGNANLSLLFKASVHGFNASTFHNKCDRQGPTVTVAYNNSGYIFGAFTSKDYAQTGQNIIDDKAFLFSFNTRDDKPPLRVVSTNPQLSFTDGNAGPNFGSLLFIYNNTPAVYSNPGVGLYNFNPEEMFGNNLQLTECEVYRVEGLGSLMEKPWRNIGWNLEQRKVLMDKITSWTPSVSSVQKARVLLVGSIGVGKSSFFNSLKSIYKGHVSWQANTGAAATSLTTQFRAYSIKSGGKRLPLTVCDTMGLEDGPNAGLDIDDFTNILKGHIQDRYQFNPSMPLQSDSPFFCKAPTLKEKIHAVVYVMDATKVKLLSEKMVEKLCAFRRKANHMGIPQMVLMTKVDEACSSVAEDLKNVYHSRYIHKMMQEVSVSLGVSLGAVVPVKNYSSELELNPQTDILLLNAILQIIRTAEAFFDDMSSDEE